MVINLVHDDVLATLSTLRGTATDLREARRRAERRVDALLDGGWHGRAAAGYTEGWEDWRAGCERVITALDLMAELIEAARHDVVGQDEVARDVLARLQGQLA